MTTTRPRPSISLWRMRQETATPDLLVRGPEKERRLRARASRRAHCPVWAGTVPDEPCHRESRIPGNILLNRLNRAKFADCRGALGNASTNRNFTLTNATNSTIDIATGTNLTISGASTATTGALTKAGAGTLTLLEIEVYSCEGAELLNSSCA